MVVVRGGQGGGVRRLGVAGQIFLETVLSIVDSAGNLTETFRERMGQATAGTLDIAAGESTILYLLADFVSRYGKRYPEVQLHLHNVTGRDGLAMLRAGDVDLAVGSMIETPQDISYVPTLRYDPVLITSVYHPLAGREQVTLEEVSRCGPSAAAPSQHLPHRGSGVPPARSEPQGHPGG